MTLTLAVLAALAPAALAAGPRIMFTRTLAPPHDLADADHVAVIYAIGDSDKVTTFVDELTDAINRSGTMHIENAVENNHHFTLSESEMKAIRKQHPADVYLGVNLFTCSGQERSMEGSEHTMAGDRIRRVHQWVDATCKARVDIINSESGKRLFSFHVRGEGTSPRSVELTPDERDVAFLQAAHYAAVRAAEEITPRLVRESVELDDSAPDFDEAFAMVRSDRLGDARAIWEASLRQHRDSASLYFDLGAVCEAAGDVSAAHDYFQRAVRLSPHEHRYASELTLFQRRNTRPKK
jgi:tetratricopeptide (TPR) repeat protein